MTTQSLPASGVSLSSLVLCYLSPASLLCARGVKTYALQAESWAGAGNDAAGVMYLMGEPIITREVER